MRRLSGSFNEVAQRDEQLIEEAALETLFEYTANPHKYDAERSSLATYLTQAAKRDLINALEREKTQGRRATSIHPVEHQLTSGNNSFEEQVADNADAQVAWEVVMETITDPQDRSLLALLLQGERATTAYAKVLGITHLPEQEQRATVKRHKDRLDKRLQRLGETLNG
jgi:RNA polymerase sigma-70 factor (ECF subfamily)